MRTSLKYGVSREDKIDYSTGKETSVIKSRGFTFCVSGAKSQDEHVKMVLSFQDFIVDHGYSADGFGDGGSWDDCVRLNDTKSFLYLSIPVDDTEAKNDIMNLYKKWKKGQ